MEPFDTLLPALAASPHKPIASCARKLQKRLRLTAASDLTILCDLCQWLCVHDCTEQLEALYPTILSIEFTGDWNRWSPVEGMLALVCCTAEGTPAAETARERLLKARGCDPINRQVIENIRNGLFLDHCPQELLDARDSGSKTLLRETLRCELGELQLVYALGGSEKYPPAALAARAAEVKRELQTL